MPRTQAVYQQIRDERAEQILQSASRIFIEKGLLNTKISDIAEAAGISQGLLYRYFANKEEILTAMVDQYTKGVMQRVQEVLDTPGTPYQKLHQLTERLLQGIASNPARNQLILQALTLPGPASELVQAMANFLRDNARQLIIDGQTAGAISLGDPDQLVVLYLCTIQGLAAGLYFFAKDSVENFPDVTSVLRMFKA